MKEILNHLLTGEPATPQHVTDVISLLMAGELDPVYAGAFLALQMRNGINGDQLKAALDVMMNFANTIDIKDKNAVDNCGTGGDGGASFNVSTTACFVIAGAGHTVAKHGNRAVSSTCGSADLLEALGVNLALKPDQIRQCIDEVGVGFMFAPVFHPAVRHAVPIRKALKIRTMFNMLGPLANPAGTSHQLIGVFAEDLTEIFGEALAKMGKTGYVVYGEDGADEVSLATRTKITEVRDGQFQSYIFDPRRHGFDLVEPEELSGGNLEANKQIFENILREKKAGPAMDMVVLNAGFAMHTTGAYSDLDQAFDAARDAIVSGKAWQKLDDLVSWSRDHAEG